MRHMFVRLAGFVMLPVVCQMVSGQLLAEVTTLYTPTMIADHTAQLSASSYVTQTASGDANMVVGQSYGWPDNPSIPQHDLYGYKIMDSSVSGPRLKVVMISGNHNTEDSGNWSLQGAVDFWVGADPCADYLRKNTELYVYPMVNPDGRFTNEGRGNPEMSDLGYGDDHNRVWDTTGLSTIDALTDAMETDTGGQVDYFFDFHSTLIAGNGHFFFTVPELVSSDYAIAMTAREPTIEPRSSSGDSGMSRIWAMSEAGLNATFAFTTEEEEDLCSEDRYMEIGRNYALALYDVMIVPEPSTLVLLLTLLTTVPIVYALRCRKRTRSTVE